MSVQNVTAVHLIMIFQSGPKSGAGQQTDVTKLPA